MIESISQANQYDELIIKSIKVFFVPFRIYSILKAANAYKEKDIPVVEVFKYLFLLVFTI